MGSVADTAAIAWPLALTLATVALTDRRRRARRRDVLNRGLHELRRPLQALALSVPVTARSQLDLVIAALADLDREINGGAPPPRRFIDASVLASDAVERWRDPARALGRAVELRWRAGASRILCDPHAVGRALDNLIANALEHGSGTVRVDGTAATGRVRLTVSDEGRSAERSVALAAAARDWRRGHGRAVVAAVAAAHGGRFASCADARGTSAVLELPLVS
ncbi:MAG TPA: ATP-binding protein [Solirubrobacterales bacterium]|nr:ATP-binding protein [Solirubrobacterales bacterium]